MGKYASRETTPAGPVTWAEISGKPNTLSGFGLATEVSTAISTAIANLVDTAPVTLDTLNELAAALGDDPNFATTVTNLIAAKAPIDNPSFTGNVGVGCVATRKLSIQGGEFTTPGINGIGIRDSASERLILGYNTDGITSGLVPSQIIASTSDLNLASRDIAAGAIIFKAGAGLSEKMRINSSGIDVNGNTIIRGTLMIYDA